MISIKKVGILYHPMKEAALPLALRLEDLLKSKGVPVWVCSAWEVEDARATMNGTDLILSVGGDGTILRAAQTAIPGPAYITGVNLGNLGFMTELSVAEAEEKLTALLAGEGWSDERSLLEAEIKMDGKTPSKFYALNDVVVARGEIARVIHVETSIDGEPLTTYRADGVIAATATGSTGYSLAAGGPVLNPQAKEMLLVPIMPHLSLSYPLVLASTSVVTFRIVSPQQATISVDGHINLPLPTGSVITVRHSANTIRFLRIHPAALFYGSLERRLKGKIN